VTRPIGPYSLYWACRIQGAHAYRAGKALTDCPYGDTREFSGRAWRDGWRAAAKAAGVKLPHKIPVI
jgi:ribosome modulation factor